MGVLVKVCINMYSWYGNTFSGGGLGPVGLTLNHTWHRSQIAWLLLEHWSPEGANGNLLLGDCLVRILGLKQVAASKGFVNIFVSYQKLVHGWILRKFVTTCRAGYSTSCRGGRISSQGCLSSEPDEELAYIKVFFWGNFWEIYEVQILWLRCG